MKLTKRHARKVYEVVGYGLVSGVGVPEPGRMCVEAAVCYALGMEHSDRPECVHPAIRSFKISLNDSKWSSNEARAKGLSRIAIAQLGSTEIDGNAWIAYVAEQHIRQIVPIPFRILANQIPSHKEALLEAANRCENEGTQEAAEAARASARAAMRAAAAVAWGAEASAAAWGAEAAASAAVKAAASAAARAAATNSEPDRILSLSAEIATQACINFKTQGSKWLDIVK